MTVRNITQLEIPLLSERFNFTDGHAHRRWTSEELSRVENVTSGVSELSRESLPELESDYLDAFFGLLGQTRPRESWICSNASAAIEIVANLLRLLNKRRVALVEPCFDNLADIFLRHDALLFPISDKCYGTDDFTAGLPESVDAYCLVSPNNPTGRCLSHQNLIDLFAVAEREDAIVILDGCFRAFEPERDDVYSLLQSAGCSWVVIEDTGKTWPTLELKAPVLSVSSELEDLAYTIFTDMFLHPSPFTLKLVTAFVKASHLDDLSGIQTPVAANRELLESILGDRFPVVSTPFMSVAWVCTAPFGGEEWAARMASCGVHVLPGRRFYWTDRGDVPFVRVALNRDRAKFTGALPRIAAALAEWQV